MILRFVLVMGMVTHKLVWEFLNPRDQRPAGEKVHPPVPPLKRLVKIGKVGFLAFLVLQTLFLDLFPIAYEPAALQIGGLLVYLVGLGIAITGRFQLGENWSNLEDRQVKSGQQLVTNGLYSYIRHPIYTGDILLVLGLELALNSWLFLLAFPLALVVWRQTLQEERQLVQEFAGYQNYRRQTKMFIPFLI